MVKIAPTHYGFEMNNPIETALSVTGVTQYIQSLLEDDPQLIQLWVTGEVSSFKS